MEKYFKDREEPLLLLTLPSTMFCWTPHGLFYFSAGLQAQRGTNAQTQPAASSTLFKPLKILWEIVLVPVRCIRTWSLAPAAPFPLCASAVNTHAHCCLPTLLSTGTSGGGQSSQQGLEGPWERRNWRSWEQGSLEASKPTPEADWHPGTTGRQVSQLAPWQLSSLTGRGCIYPVQGVSYKESFAVSCCSRAPWAPVPPLSSIG